MADDPTTGGAGAGGAKAAHGPGSWHHMLRRVFVDAPKELQKSARARDNMRQLRQRRGLR